LSELQEQTARAEPPPPRFHDLACAPGTRLAYRKIAPRASGASESASGGSGSASGASGIVWLGGYRSDMLSSKAEAIAGFAEAAGRAFLRFDYSGHGESEGDFADGAIGTWTRQSLEMIRTLTAGPQVLVGSSMGGWIALLLARELARAGEAERLAGMVLIAPAVDFTQDLMWEQFPEEVRAQLRGAGVWMRPTEYAPEPVPVTMKLIEDGKANLLFGATIRSHCPVHILQGMEDPDVPWRHALKLVEHLAGDPVALTLIKDGDHRLSRDEDIERLLAAIAGIA